MSLDKATMTSSTPTTPTISGPRRSVSLPVPKPQTGPDAQIEVLFILSSARIISFQTSSSTSRPSSSSDSPVVEEESGTLPWVSRFERTIAVGPLRIYRAPGSVAFLNCQNALRPILPKSQCWAVDEDSSKFVLQIRRPQYWRIEVPTKTPEEKRLSGEFKEVLGKVLLFEKTPCPFQRSFTVELPETPKTPIKKKPWKPVEKPKIGSLHHTSDSEDSWFASPVSATRRSSTSSPLSQPSTPSPPAKNRGSVTPSQLPAMAPVIESDSARCSSDASSSPPESVLAKPLDELSPLGCPPTATKSDLPPSSVILEPSLLESSMPESVFANFKGSEEDDCYSDATDDTNITPRSQFQPTFQSMTFEPDNSARIPTLQHCSRSITAPPLLSLVTSPPSKHRTGSPLRRSISIDSDSGFSSSVESFHSVQSWHSPLAPPSPPASGPPSPTDMYPYPHNNIVLSKRPAHTRDVSEVTVIAETPRVWDMASTPRTESAPMLRSVPPPPKTPTPMSDTNDKSDEEQFQIVTPLTASPNIRHRATTSSNSRRRALSPLPAAVNLFSPPRRRSRRLQTARHLPTAIIQKTCEILLSPPSHLLHLMLNIASKIAAGEWRGVLSGYGEAVHWDFEDEYAGEGWTEDDYGISLPNPATKEKNSVNVPGGSWEVD